jgi:hypothetical protein
MTIAHGLGPTADLDLDCPAEAFAGQRHPQILVLSCKDCRAITRTSKNLGLSRPIVGARRQSAGPRAVCARRHTVIRSEDARHLSIR